MKLTSKRLLQVCVVLGGCVPVFAGMAGIIFGPAMTGDTASLSLDSHFHYLSGLLLGIGFGFWSQVPNIEKQHAKFQLLTAIVVIGGLARLIALVTAGVPNGGMLFGLCMELVITPLLAYWQSRIAKN